MADLSKDDIKSLGRAVGIELDEPLLTEVTYNLNALRDLLDEVNPSGLDRVEPLPIVPPHERCWQDSCGTLAATNDRYPRRAEAHVLQSGEMLWYEARRRP
jgi:hypothetical protein